MEPFLVTARKYRPQVFEDVLGQEHITKTLQNALQRKKVAHAYLFSGPRGIGKTTTARILAKALNCTNNNDGNPCNECHNCTAITAGKHVDIIEIDAASNRGIDNIRDLRREVLIAPAEAQYKVYIIDEVHMLSIDAFNALLKTLEEPPSHVKFVLATTEIHKIPATIASRCQRFSFRQVPISVLTDGLRSILEKEAGSVLAEEVREQALYYVAKMGGGSVRDAESALDQLISFVYQGVSIDEIRTMLGLLSTDLLDEFVRAVHSGQVVAGLKAIAKTISEGIDVKQFLGDLLEYYRHLLVAKDLSADAGDLIELPSEALAQLNETAEMLNRPDLLSAMEILWQAEERLRISGEGRIVLENAALRISALPKMLEVQSILEYLERISDSVENGNVIRVEEKKTVESREVSTPPPPPKSAPQPAAASEKPPVPPPEKPKPIAPSKPDLEVDEEELDLPDEEPVRDFQIDLKSINHFWNQIVETVREADARLGACVADSQPIRVLGKTLVLGIPEGFQFHLDQLTEPEKMTKIQSAIQKATGYQIQVTVEFSSEVQSKNLVDPNEPTLDTEKQKRVDELAVKYPELQTFIDRVEGKVLDLRPLRDDNED